MSVYDVAVIGTGGVGSAAFYHLAQAGANVIGLDRFTPPHDRGSSHGDTRVIRMAYFEHPDYVPLLRQAYQGWHALEEVAGKQIYFPTGVLQIGPEQGEVIAGIRASAAQHNLAIESFTASELPQAFPGVHPPENCVGLFERDAGYLLVSECVAAYLTAAQKLGATLRTNTAVESWEDQSGTFAVRTATETLHAKQLVICGGAWASQLIADLGVPLTILRKHLYWYENASPCYTAGNFPVFLMETPLGIYYGFPQIDSQGVKLARHDGGQPIERAEQHSQVEDSADRHSVQQFMSGYLPQLSHNLARHAACMYTMTPDQHFLVGTHPAHPGLHFAGGLSGHGFKFASALGEILSDLVTQGQTTAPIAFLSATRFS
ncbi:N-methyl-L-tryptophan oxidase [Blastopirellula marina]|uniref:N-methyl-L-tryptophan oxidase n=1 Tax=Blastopirellula marina TaxID=124 RepID=A0A2S8FCY5_9BACT|nr:N-methyl-L-tryptophan oxidase [Blastopirellula marina]PQO30009.1 N-methyl-L-tryptophan oxidase [Blastopirellula marina]PTL42478.1 N-methyl-L-tryptophan oxidase [Blastopirellula marina]